MNLPVSESTLYDGVAYVWTPHKILYPSLYGTLYFFPSSLLRSNLVTVYVTECALQYMHDFWGVMLHDFRSGLTFRERTEYTL